MGLYHGDEFLEVKLLGEKSMCIYNFASHCRIALYRNYTDSLKNAWKGLFLHIFSNMMLLKYHFLMFANLMHQMWYLFWSYDLFSLMSKVKYIYTFSYI